NDLAALSMEREEVFEATHQLVFRLLQEGKVDGLRIDHPDGLFDPEQYFLRLQERYVSMESADGKPPSSTPQSPIRNPQSGRWPLYVVAEKILGAGEPLPEGWAVYGTSGYEFVNAANGLFVDGSAEEAFTRLYREWVQDYSSFPEVVYRSKRLILEVSLASELHMLAHQLDRLAPRGPPSRDFTLNSLRDALREVIACFPVYRSYISGDKVHETDRKYVQAAVRRAAARNSLMSRSLFRFVRDMLLLEYPEGATEEDRAEQ